MRIGKGVHVMPGVFFDEDYASLISIGDNCTITSGVRILAHDASLYRDLGFGKIGKVEIRENTFIGNNAVILPGVSIGPNAIIGAGSIVAEDIPPNSVAAGNPAKKIMQKDVFLAKHQENFKNAVSFDFRTFINGENNIPVLPENFTRGYIVGGETEANLKWLEDERCRK